MKAILKFNNSNEAETFALNWSRYSCSGHTVANNTVTIYNVTEENKTWINNYINKLN